jgi:hypothetical protein
MRTSDELSTAGLGRTQNQTRSDLPQTDPLGQAASAQAEELMCQAVVTREDFVRMILSDRHPLRLSLLERMQPGATMAMGVQEGLTNGARPSDPITRAEAAQMLTRAAGIDDAEIDGNVCYFYDVPSGAWEFGAAHRCRMFGIFKGTLENLFLPQGTLDPTTAQALVRRAASPTPLSLDEQKLGLNVEPPSRLAAVYPGSQASAEAKYAFYVYVLHQTGHGAAHSHEKEQYSLIGLRGLSINDLDNLYSRDPEPNTNATYDDLLVIVGQDSEGKPVVREYPGSTDPGKAGLHQMQAGEYGYEYEGQSFTSVSGHTVNGAYFRMTPETYQSQWSVTHDKDRDGKYDGDSGNESVSEKGNKKYLIHRGGDSADGKVGEWSYGCQVFAGRNEAGEHNVDDAARLLRKNQDEKFTYILIEGQAVVKALRGERPG